MSKCLHCHTAQLSNYANSLSQDHHRRHSPSDRLCTTPLLTTTMAIPFEALIPYGIILGMFGATGAGLSKFRNWQNGGKRQLMDRDRRITGFLRGQSDNPIAPAGFELNNPWRTEKRIA
ncbi:hypothetical protein F4780DRAFT_777264 [Xylariomycetidae sp. FL0641]|nr:hypothetical protein F4780DRAFT_777264 [Xylariomycetidae sp. FL0641]